MMDTAADGPPTGPNERFQLALDAVDIVGTWDWDVSADEVHADAFSAAFIPVDTARAADGVSVEGLTARIHPEDRGSVERAIHAALVDNAEFTQQYRLLRSDGTVRCILARGRRCATGDGARRRFVGVAFDITARQAIEATLAESAAFTRLILDSTYEGFYSVDRDGVTTLCNAAFARMLGFVRSEDALGKRLHDLIHHSHADGSPYPTDQCPIYIAAQTGQAAHVDHEVFFRLDGTRFPVEYRATPIYQSGSLKGAICTVNDVTERVRAEESLGRSEAASRERARTMKILNETGAAIAATLDLKQLVQKVTDAGVEITDARIGAFFYNVVDERGESYMLHALSGPLKHTFASFAMPRNTAIFGPAFVGGGVIRSGDITADARYGHNPLFNGIPAGHPPVRSYLAVSVTSRSGEVLGGLFFGHPNADVFTEACDEVMVGLAAQAAIAIDNARLFENAQREIADRKRAEDALQILNATLEDRVAVEVAERASTEEQLRQAQKMEAVGQLTGGIAHDFNNLLQGIVGSLDLVRKRIVDGRIDDVQRFVDGAMESARRAAAMTHRLLAFSRRQPLDPKPVDTNQLVASMEDLVRRTIGEGVRVELVLADGLWPTLCDRNQLESALLNLVINARDAMPDGGHLTIETCNTNLTDAYAARRRDVKPGQYVCLCVTDSGTGMTPKTIARAFDPFFTTKPIGKGTGLGLSMIYGFARQSDGQAKIYSEVGKGTTVKLYLPRHRTAETVTAPMPRATEKHRSADGEIVLVVEDEMSVRGLIVEVLDELGYSTLEAEDGPAALTILNSNQRVDLLITDVGLPGLNGRQVADAARLRRQGLKILFITGYAANGALSSGYLDPGMAMLSKPFAIDNLATRVRQMLEPIRR